MSDLRLKSGTTFSPQGIDFVDPKTKYTVSGYERSIDGAVRMMIAHRRANPATFNQAEHAPFSETLVRQEYLRHIFTKRPDLFQGQPTPSVTRTETGFPKQCPNCQGTNFEPEYCKTCGSGNRTSGYRCTSCNKLFGL